MSEPIPFTTLLQLFQNSIAAAGCAAVTCGLLGVFVVMRRVAFVSAALGQVSGLGIVLGFLAGSLLGHEPHAHTPLWLDPVVIALVLAGFVAAGFGFVARVKRTTPESVVALTYLLAAALALLILASPRLVSEAHEVEALLFGSAVAVEPEHLYELLAVSGAVLISQVFLFRALVFASFDGEMARTLGLPVRKLELVLHLSIGLTVAVATRAIGALPVFGFLVLPASAALIVSDNIRVVAWLSMAFSLVGAFVGFYTSTQFPDLGTGPMMVVACAAFWPLGLLCRAVLARLRPLAR